MGAQKLTLRKRLVAGLGTIAMASLAVFGAGAAHAAPAGEGNIDFDATGSITVHKHSQPETAGDPASGGDQGILPNPLQDVEFSLQKVTSINLEEVDDWGQLNDLTPAKVKDNLGPVQGPLRTNDNGIVTFSNLDLGVYLVTEGADHGGNNIVRKAEPFLVMIPIAVDNEWNYDVHVYPKNSQAKVSKELDEASDDTAAGAGDIISWNVKATAPLLAPDDKLHELRYVDELDARLKFVDVTNVVYAGQDLHEHQYRVTPGQTVTIELTKAGLEAVQQNQGKELTYKINTKVAKNATIGDGLIANKITQYTRINDQRFDFSTTADHTYWGTVLIKKFDKENEKALAEAEFQVFRSHDDAVAKRDPVIINDQDTFTTGANGVVEIGALNARAEQSHNYWLVETKAPAGYQLDDTPREIVITPGTQTATYEILNEKQPAIDLPLTGAAGTGVFMLIGLALLTLGGGLYTRNRRKAQA